MTQYEATVLSWGFGIVILILAGLTIKYLLDGRKPTAPKPCATCQSYAALVDDFRANGDIASVTEINAGWNAHIRNDHNGHAPANQAVFLGKD